MEAHSVIVKAALLSDAVQAIRLGQRSLAREILTEILQNEPDNEHAYIWSATVAETHEEAIYFLECVLRVNPYNQLASNILATQRLNHYYEPTAPVPPPPQAAGLRREPCPLCGSIRNLDSSPCPGCECVPSIYDLPRLTANTRTVNVRLLEDCLQKHKLELDNDPTFDGYMTVALALLNLNRSGEALPYLWRAWNLQTQDARLRQFIDNLASRKLILVIDDSATVRRLVSVTLEREGHRVRTAVNGLDGLEKFEEETPDLVLTDITMPEMDGYELCRMIRRNPNARGLPILMLSGNDGFFDKVRGKMAGATDYLTKPFHSDVLLRSLEKFLNAENPIQPSEREYAQNHSGR